MLALIALLSIITMYSIRGDIHDEVSSFDSELYFAITIPMGMPIESHLPIEPELEGYIFLHWSGTFDGDAFDLYVPVITDTVLYAHWQEANAYVLEADDETSEATDEYEQWNYVYEIEYGQSVADIADVYDWDDTYNYGGNYYAGDYPDVYFHDAYDYNYYSQQFYDDVYQGTYEGYVEIRFYWNRPYADEPEDDEPEDYGYIGYAPYYIDAHEEYAYDLSVYGRG